MDDPDDQWDEKCVITLVQTKQGRKAGQQPQLVLRCLQRRPGASGGYEYYWIYSQNPARIAAHMNVTSSLSSFQEYKESDDNDSRTNLTQELQQAHTGAVEYGKRIYGPYINFWTRYAQGLRDGTAFTFPLKMKDSLLTGDVITLSRKFVNKWAEWLSPKEND